MFDRMIDDHNQIRGIAASLRESLAEDRMPIAQRFATARWALTRHLLRHFAVEDAIFRKHGCAARSAAPGGRGTFEQQYRQHVNDWTPERIDRDWPRYRIELSGILHALDRRMTIEERDIYPALSRSMAAAAA